MRRTEEQGRQRAMQTQRLELEAELARVRHAHDLDVADLHTRLQATADQDEQYPAVVIRCGTRCPLGV